MPGAHLWPAVVEACQRSLRRLTGLGAVPIGMLLCGVLLSGCDRTGPRKAPAAGLNVILISMDTTRADHLACYGHPRIKTPNIDRLATEGTLFTQCTSAVPITLPSHASMLTGAYPFVHRVRDNGAFQLHSDNLTLAEVLRDAGYATAAQVGASVLSHEFGLDQGFAVYRDVGFTIPGASKQRARAEITAEQVTDGAIDLLRQVAGQRFFLFVHYFDPHHPYEAPERFARQYMNPYLAEIAYTDEQIGRLLAAVKAAGVGDETLVILTADHGEGLGQHQEATHGYFVYDATLMVPLIFWCPGQIPAGSRVVAQVRLIDIAPTVLALLGLAPLPDAQGVDLSPLLFGTVSDLQLAAYAETFSPRYSLGFSQLRALRYGPWKYIHAPQPELYQISKDPQELNNVAALQPKRVAEMRARLHELIERAPHVVNAGQAHRPVSAQELQALEALGYVGGASASAPSEPEDELALFEPVGPNPMKHVREIQLTTEAIGLVLTGQHEKVEKVIRALLAEAGERSRHFAWAHAHLAGALAAQGKLEEALEHFELAVQHRLNDGQMHTMKGIVLHALGRTDEAIAAFRQAVSLEPVFAITHLNFGIALAAAGQTDEAIEQYRLATEKDPQMMRAHINLVRLLARSNRMDEALAALDRALEIADAAGDTQAVKRLQALRRRYQEQKAAAKAP